MTLPLGSDPYTDLTSQLGLSTGDTNPYDWLAGGMPVDQPATPQMPVEGGTTKNEPHTVAAPPGAAATGGAIGVALDKAMTYLGTMYDWGGNGADGRGVDCSGLLYAAFKSAGFNIQRYRAVDYGHMGTQVTFQDARPGDIVYFDNPGTDVDHVGIYLGNGKYIEAPHQGAQVQISTFNPNGTGQIRRIFPESDFNSLAVSPSGNAQFHAANGQTFTTTSQLRDPVSAIMSQLSTTSDPNALIQGLDAQGSLEDLLKTPVIPGAGSGKPVPATRDAHDFTPVEAKAGGYTVGDVHGLSEPEAYIIQHESGGNPTAQNPTSSAFGIWQGLQSTREMYAQRMGFDPNTTNVNQQLQMFRQYISDRYGSAEQAEAFWRSHHWY